MPFHSSMYVDVLGDIEHVEGSNQRSINRSYLHCVSNTIDTNVVRRQSTSSATSSN